MAVWTTTPSPAGRIGLAATVYGICNVSVGVTPRAFARSLKKDSPDKDWREDPENPVLASAREQLAAYFDRALQSFEVPLDLSGSPFQRAVWDAVRQIPWGQARSYQEVAAMVGRPRAMRAVGNTMNACQVSILIPCHRVTGAGGKIGGWGGDIRGKKWLLEFEGISYR